MTRPRFALHPGWVVSRTDGDHHWISASRLAELYQLAAGEWLEWNAERPASFLGLNPSSYTHLFPRPSGDYRPARTLRGKQ